MARLPKGAPVLIDVAGAAVGGSGRFLLELDAYLEQRDQRHSVQIIGRNRRLTPSWLVQRESYANSFPLRIALNNASFAAPRGRNVVLLRNVLHFARREELRRHSFTPSLELRAQSPLVRRLARRAHQIVVPTSAMAKRVRTHTPSLAHALSVRGHPVAQRDWAGREGNRRVGILVPIVPSPYKNLDEHVWSLLRATNGPGFEDLNITVTAHPHELPLSGNHPRLNFLGRVSADRLDNYWEECMAVYYPTTLEAFGYPLAEARVNGRFVIAQDTDQNEEVAGDALCSYRASDLRSLEAAVRKAVAGRPRPDASVNDPESYFDWLLAGAYTI